MSARRTMQIRSTRLLGCIVFLVGLLLPIRAQSPLADAFADSGLVTQVSWNLTTVISTNVASAEPGEPAHAGYPARASQWTRFRFEQDGYAHIPLLSIGALRFAVYTGESLDQLHEVASAHVMERWQAFGWEVQAGVTYHLAIDLPARGTLIGQTHSMRGNFSRVFLRPQTTPWPSQAPATVTWEFVNLDPAETPLSLRFSINGTARPAITAPPWAVTTTVPAGGIVNVQVDGQTDQRFLRDVPVSTRGFQPPNDDWADATAVPLDAVDWTGVGNTSLATSEDGEPPFSAFMGAGRTVWWRWSPAFTGHTRIQWSRETLQLFRGNALTNLVQLPDDPRAGFRAEAGTSYAFRIANPFSASLADIAITLTRTVLSLGAPNGHLMETNASGAREIHVVAGRSHSFPVHELNPLDAYATLQLEQETPEGWQTVATTSATPRSFALSLASGQNGQYRVTGTNQQGALRVSDPVWVIAAPAHDRFEDAVELPAGGTTTWTWTGLGSAGRQPGEPDPGPGVAGGSLWHRWTPASAGTGRILLPEVTGPTTVTVYTGTVLTNLVPIASKTVSAAGGPIELPFPVDAGTAYSIAVIGAEPTLPASLGWIPVRVESVSPEQTAGRPVRLAASQSSGTPVEVTWLLQGEVLTTMTPMPTATDLWTPSQPGGFSLRATIPWEGGTVVLFETVGTVRPVNDRPENAATAELWEGVPGAQVATGSLLGASRDSGVPSAFEGGSGTVWFDWTLPGGTPRIRQAPGEAPVRVEVFEVTAGGALTPKLSITNLNRAVDVPLTAGTVCKLAVSSADIGAQTFTLYLGQAPTNDDFARAELLGVPPAGGSVTLTNANVFATTEPDEAGRPDLVHFQRHGNLWWRFTAPGFGTAEFHLLDSPAPGIAAVYTGTALTNLQVHVGPEVANGNPVAWVPFSVQPGQTYWIAAGGHPAHDATLGPVGGTFTYTPTPSHLANDDFADAIVLTGANPVIDTWLSHASVEPGEPLDAPTLQQSLWWRWTAPADGRLDQLPIHELLPPATVYEGSSLATLRRLPNIPPAAHLGNFSAVAVTGGTEYWIQYAAPADLTVALSNPLRFEGSSELRILRQPVGTAVVLGQYLTLDVLASGTPPFAYQWFRNGEALTTGVQRQLVLDAVTRDQLGTYEVRVTSAGQTILSLPAPVIEAPAQAGGGLIRFAATERAGAPPFRVTDVDGTTLLEGDTYVAQLYVGTNPETLRPIGTPAAFLTGASAGRWIPQNLMLPHIAPGASFQAQVRVWDRTTGASYEEARASGGRFGRSVVTSAVAGNPLVPPEAIDTFQAFSLTAGLPGFTAGIIEPVSVTPQGAVTWKLTGAVGFRYLLERLSGNAWSPVEVIPNFPGTWTFTTPPAEGLELYRARVVD